MTVTDSHAVFQALLISFRPFLTDGDDGSHDLAHLHRVWKNALKIQSEEGGDIEILAAAVLLHDCVSVEKNSPQRPFASRLAAQRASEILTEQGWDQSRVAQVAHAIEAHSFSANIPPQTLEAKILQDADRLDAIGMLGAARCFYTAGRMKSKMYNSDDPHGENRSLDDSKYAIDHFQLKLFKLGDRFQTVAGSKLAAIRQERLRVFLEQFLDEI